MNISRKAALITGASSGIGQAVAVEFAKHGLKLVIAGRNVARLEETAQLCYKQGLKEKDVYQFIGDLSNRETCEKLVDQAVEQFGELDVLVNNAGFPQHKPLLECTPEDYHYVFDTIFEAVFIITQRALPTIIANKGTIINVSSAVALKPEASAPLYSMAKMILNQYTKALALELGTKQTGSTANVVGPGVTLTRALGDLESDQPVYENLTVKQLWDAYVSKNVPNKKLMTPEDQAHVIVFLASDEAKIMNGSIVAADHGYTC